MDNKNNSILSSRKDFLMRQIIRISQKNFLHRAIHLCDSEKLKEEAKPIIQEFEYLCNLEKGGQY